MWTELFLENGDFLASEIDLVVENLQKYSEAIKAGDAERLEVLLREGRIAKEQSEKE
jgi:prephenate dehydrogenase